MNRAELFPIGDVARLFHISVSSLRHYEKLGLLQPEYIDPDTGYRYYSIRQFEPLNTIRYLRTLDMPLLSIVDFLKNRDVERMEEKLRQQKEAVIAKERELKRTERKIDKRLKQLKDAKNSVLEEVRLIRTEVCRMMWVKESLKIQSFMDMEEPVHKLHRSESESVVFLGKVGLGILKEHLLEGEFGQYDGIFLVLDEEDFFEGETITLPETRCVSLRFRGGHEAAPARYKQLMEYIRAHGMEVSGFSREITLIDYGFSNDTEKFETENSIHIEGA